MKTPADNSPVELRPVSVGELVRQIDERRAQPRPPLTIVGGRTSLSHPAGGDCLVTTGLARVVDYPSRDMTITVEAGLKAAELQRILAEQGQTLPVDVPEARRATIGGAVASNTSGPGRYGYGTFRDYLIGMRAVDGRGRLFAAGGRVVKNVAGYDLCKLMVGSRGRLAAIAELTFKLRPLPETRRLVWVQARDWPAVEAHLEGLVTTATRPVAIEVLNPQAAAHLTRESKLGLPDQGPVVCLAFDGAEGETVWQVETLQQEFARHPQAASEVVGPEDAHDLWTSLTEYQSVSDEPLTFQAVLRPSQTAAFLRAAADQQTAAQAHAGSGVVVGHLPDHCTDARSALSILQALEASIPGGRVHVHRCDPEWTAELGRFWEFPWTPIERQLRAALDPDGLFAE